MFKKILLIGAVILFGLALFDVRLGSLHLIPGGLLLFAGAFLAESASAK